MLECYEVTVRVHACVCVCVCQPTLQFLARPRSGLPISSGYHPVVSSKGAVCELRNSSHPTRDHAAWESLLIGCPSMGHPDSSDSVRLQHPHEWSDRCRNANPTHFLGHWCLESCSKWLPFTCDSRHQLLCKWRRRSKTPLPSLLTPDQDPLGHFFKKMARVLTGQNRGGEW